MEYRGEEGGCPGFVTPTGFSDFKNITINFDSSFLIVSTTYYTLHSFETSIKLSIMFPGSWREMFNGMFVFLVFSPQISVKLCFFYSGYSYERLDGSVRGEERNLAVKNFSSEDIFVFLLSTKAGD